MGEKEKDMKITFDTDKKILKVGKTLFEDLEKEKQEEVRNHFREIIKTGPMSDYEEDCMWMSYRYCIGGHTIATHLHSYEIFKNCYGRMSDERSVFTAFDINREIEDKLRFGVGGPDFHFPSTGTNRIYTSALDIYFQFLEDYNIKSKEELLRYKSVEVILTDNERGYKFEPKMHDGTVADKTKKEPSYFFMSSVRDLMVWNDLVHLFDKDHHHKSLLEDGSEIEWFWTYTQGLKTDTDGKFYLDEFTYKKVRVPVNEWTSFRTTYIPADAIKEDLW